MLEQLVQQLLATVLVQSKRTALRPGELDFSRGVGWAYRIGLLRRDELADLRLLGRIRNEYAHNWDPNLDFDSAQIRDWVLKLSTPDSPVLPARGVGASLAPLGDPVAFARISCRNRWLMATIQMMIRLLIAIENARPFEEAGTPAATATSGR